MVFKMQLVNGCLSYSENCSFSDCTNLLDNAFLKCRISTANAVSDKSAQGTLHKFCMAKTQAW